MGRAPCISDGPGPGKRDGGSRAHHGVDIDYRRARGTLTQFRPGTREASSGGLFFCPDGVNVLAAYDGTIWSVGTSDRGLQIVIDHGKPYATYYQHLRTTRWPELRRGAGGIRVKAGEVIGTVGNGHSPGKASASAFNHLHFEIWHAGGAESWIDPSAILAKARVVTL
jgi:murein DD-endopeptidase MepM/ murein hydrolase activator NlpD